MIAVNKSYDVILYVNRLRMRVRILACAALAFAQLGPWL